jgi:hypothetical protein
MTSLFFRGILSESMWDFDGDEAVFFVVAALGTAAWVIRSCIRLASIEKFKPWPSARTILVIVPIVCGAFTFAVIQSFSDPQVRGHADYVTLFMLGQGLWLAMTCWGMRAIGVSIGEDVIEGNNPAALVVVAAGMLATSIVYAASNIGSGPTIWTTIVPALLATIVLGLLWIISDRIGGGLIDSIVIDRDVASALRMGGALIGCAIILGRATAGKWTGWGDTFTTMVQIGWPVVLLACAAALVNRLLRPTPSLPRPPILTYGWIPAVAYVAIGIGIVALHGDILNPTLW